MIRSIAEIARAHDERIADLPEDEADFFASFQVDLKDRVTAAAADTTPLMIDCTALLAIEVVRFNAEVVAAGGITIKNAYLFAGMVECLVKCLHTIGPQVVAGSKAETVAQLALGRSELWTSSLATAGTA